MRILILILSIGIFNTGMTDSALFSQSKTSQISKAVPVLPTVFTLGEFEKQYEEIIPGYRPLLDACKGNMKLAFDNVMEMIQEMEEFSKTKGYNLDGINIWMHFFWSGKGEIEHIGFYLKPNSRNVDTEELKKFLTKFSRHYRLPLESNIPYSLYSSFSFPLVLLTNYSPSPH